MKRDELSAPGPPLPAACIAGLAAVAAGLLLGSGWFLRLASRASADGVLDAYTPDRLGEFSWEIAAAGLLIPLIALAAPAALGGRTPPRKARALAWACVAALMACFIAVAGITPRRASTPRSQPDEIQYTIPAINALERGRLALVINGRDYPPYTPIGFQLILIPFYRLFGTMIGNGIRAVQAGALLSLAGAFALGARALGKTRGLLAAMLLAANASFIFWSQGIMPTTVILALTVGALLLLLAFRDAEGGGRRLLLAALLGALSGLQLFVSFNTAVTIPVYLVIMLRLAAGRRGKGGAWACAAAFALSAALALLPQLAYQALAYGSPLRTGYFVWFWREPPPGTPRDFPFALARAPYDFVVLNLLSAMGVDARVVNPVALLLDLAGLGALYNLAVFALFAAGIASLCRRPDRRRGGGGVLAAFAALFFLVNYAAYAFYATQGTRFFLQAVPAVLVIAAEGFCSAYASARGRSAPWRRLLLCVVLACALSGAAVAARGRFAGRAPGPCLYELAGAYRELAGEGATIVSGVSGAYLCHFLPSERGVTVLPVARDVRLARQAGRMLFPVASEEPGLIRGRLAASRPVFTDDIYADAFAKEYRALGREFDLEPVRPVCGHWIYRLREKGAVPGGVAAAAR